jgi:hypothetical protein
MDQKYPIYRKFQNGKQFMKLNSNGVLVTVYMIRGNSFSISHADNNQWLNQDFHNPELSMDSSRDEFEKAYGEAQFLLTKANNEQ